MIERLDSSLFDWQTWRAGNPVDVFGVPCRSSDLIAAGERLRAAAVGYCPGDQTPCRPKADQVAVMFFAVGRHFWFHLRAVEAQRIFGLELIAS